MAYVIYMIIGSEYAKCSFKNPMIESRLRIEYAETKSADQIKMEDEVIKRMENIIVPEELASEVRYYQDKGNIVLEFLSHPGLIRAFIAPTGHFDIIPVH